MSLEYHGTSLDRLLILASASGISVCAMIALKVRDIEMLTNCQGLKEE
jgi:hypothetical protein